MAELNWTAEAQRWLQEIYQYIAQDNPTAAAGVVEGIYGKAQALVEFPQIGHRYEPIAGREVRILLYGHYRIAYLIRTSTSSASFMARWRSSATFSRCSKRRAQ